MDDGSGGHKSYQGGVEVSEKMRAGIISAGFTPHAKKCCWTPAQRVEILGMEQHWFWSPWPLLLKAALVFSTVITRLLCISSLMVVGTRICR